MARCMTCTMLYTMDNTMECLIVLRSHGQMHGCPWSLGMDYPILYAIANRGEYVVL